MSTGFDKALINREKNRQQLAEALERKYSSERRNSWLFRAACLGAALFVARLALNASFDMSPEQQSGKLMLSQMQKQLRHDDQLMIGSGTGSGANAGNRSHGEPASFAKEKVPLSLTAEIRGGKIRGGDSPDKNSYSETKSRHNQELEELGRRKRAPGKKIDSGMYRPATSAEAAKHQPPPRSRLPLPAQDLYEHVKKPPERLAADAGAFPDTAEKPDTRFRLAE